MMKESRPKNFAVRLMAAVIGFAFIILHFAAPLSAQTTMKPKEPSNVSGKWVGVFTSSMRCTLVVYLNHYADYISGFSDTYCGKAMAKASMKGRFMRNENYYYLSEEAILDTVNQYGLHFCLCERYELRINEEGTELKGYFISKKCGGDTVRFTLRREVVFPKLELTNIYFEPRVASVNKSQYKTLQAMADALKANPKLRLEIMGFTDFSPNFDKLKPLALQRALAVKNYLTNKGIDPKRLLVNGYGYQMPEDAEEGHNEKNSPRNRRVEFKLME